MYAQSGRGAVSAVSAARTVLAALTVSLGTAGLAAAARRPEFLAQIDQHAAAIRESLGGDHRPLSVTALAGYAEGFRAAALEHGWQAPIGGIDWSHPDWPLTRLVAVCALARPLAES